MEICILQLGTYGDMILATPIISAIKNHIPEAKINFIAGHRNHLIIKHNPYVSKILIWSKLPHLLLRNIFYLRTRKFNVFVNPKDHFSREGSIISRIVRADTKVGLNRNKKIFDIEIPDEKLNSELHFTQRIFRAFEFLGIKLEDDEIPKPQLFYSRDNNDYFANFLKENNLKPFDYIVFNISASQPLKTFSDKALNEIFSQIEFNFPLALTFDYKDTERALNLRGKFVHPYLYFSRNILDVFPLIENSRAVITPDTSIVHIATAYSKKTLAFYSGLDEFFYKFHPNNNLCTVVRAEKGDPGIQTIPISQIISSIISFLQTI